MRKPRIDPELALGMAMMARGFEVAIKALEMLDVGLSRHFVRPGDVRDGKRAKKKSRPLAGRGRK